ncbi:unnamed protein product [Lactuca saligna]|uniref:Uncharacterized protein n=1 Tax=Lactuca saligna TaxID=75948 RepID=A0AA35Z5I2_LACSI|nr:unnamed protein product [Lactuca saligna]
MIIVSPSNSRRFLHISCALVSRRWISNGYSCHTLFKPYTLNEAFDHFDHLLRGCTNSRQFKQVHAQIVLLGGLSTAFLSSTLVSVYGRFQRLCDAQRVFEAVPTECLLRNTIIWNSMLRANVMNGHCRETLEVYTRMRHLGVLADEFSFPLVVRACAKMGNRYSCALVHCHALRTGFHDNLHVANELLAAYGRLGQMALANQLFDEMLVRNHISWNTMVSGFAFNNNSNGALNIFQRMELDGWEPDLVTWTSLLSSHSRCGHHQETLRLYNVMRSKGIKATAESLAVVVSVCNDPNKGRELHGYVIRAGLENYSFAKNSLLCMYGRHSFLQAAECLFSEIETKSLESWNGLISSYTQLGLCDEAFSTFLELKKSEGNITPNVITWSDIISGFASKGRHEESLKLFRQMQVEKVRPNVVTISTMLSICADLSTIVYGKEIHCHAIRGLIDDNLLVGNGLINVYSKCGSLKEGHIVFKHIVNKDLCSWNTMIKGYGMHGFGESALKTFKQMVNDGYTPDGVTFVSLLSACSHAGLVSEGHEIFKKMKNEFGIEPEIEHYTCMVDLLGRGGLFQEASEVVKKMKIEPNVCVWGALLNSSRIQMQMQMQKQKKIDWDDGCVEKILKGSFRSGNYMLVSNMYAGSGRWEESAKVRVSARAQGLTKTPGQSWIELNKKVCIFTAGEFVESEMKEVEMVIKILSFEMKMKEGYIWHLGFE